MDHSGLKLGMGINGDTLKSVLAINRFHLQMKYKLLQSSYFLCVTPLVLVIFFLLYQCYVNVSLSEIKSVLGINRFSLSNEAQTLAM